MSGYRVTPECEIAPGQRMDIARAVNVRSFEAAVLAAKRMEAMAAKHGTGAAAALRVTVTYYERDNGTHPCPTRYDVARFDAWGAHSLHDHYPQSYVRSEYARARAALEGR